VGASKSKISFGRGGIVIIAPQKKIFFLKEDFTESKNFIQVMPKARPE
jgi:hypothetical protein